MMFREKSISKLYAFALAAVFALTLAGCGGGSAMDDVDAEQAAAAEAARAVKAARDAAGLASMAAAASVTAAEADKDLDLETFVRARIAAENAEAAADAALLATDPGAAEAAQADAEAAAADAKKYSDMVLAMAKAITDMMAEDAAAAEVIRLAMVEANALQSAKGDAQAAYQMAVDALAAVDKGSDLASHTRATDALQAVSAANDAVQAAETSAAAEALVAAVEEARDVVTGFTAMVTEAKAEDDRLAEKKAEEDRIAAEAQAGVDADTASAATKVKAIGAEMDQADDAGLGGSGVATVTAAIKYGEVKINDTANAGDKDPKFVQAMDFGDGRTMHVRDNDKGEEEVVIISTDIDAPKATPFTDVYTPVAAGKTNAGTLLIVVGKAGDGQGMASKLKASQFVLAEDGTGAILTFPRYQLDSDKSVDGNQTVNAFETTTATFDGGSGKLKCNGTKGDCTVTLDAKGAIEAVSANWRFTPDADAMVDVPDADHLNYGFWLKRTTDEDGAVTYNEVETFASTIATASGETKQVGGNATYEGGAVGVYVHEVNPGGGSTPDSATSGHFNADVSLTAYFGESPDVASNKHNDIEGTIDNFTLSGGEANAWSVAVRADIAHGGATGTAKGGNGDGSFSGTFYGSLAKVDGEVPQPGSIIGEFNADFTNGTAAGAFGAKLKDD